MKYKYIVLIQLSFVLGFTTFGQTINILSVSTLRGNLTGFDGGYTLDGEHMLSSVYKLKNPKYFSDTGIYNKSVSINSGYYTPGSLEQITRNKDIDIFFFGSFLTSIFTQSEIDSLFNWSLNGGKMIIAEQVGFVNLGKKWNYSLIGSNGTAYPTTTGESTLLFNGPFGKVETIQQGGMAVGKISTTSSRFITLASNNIEGSVIVFDCYTKDLICADADIFTDLGGISTGDKIINDQDRFWANTIAFMDSYKNTSDPYIKYDGTNFKTDEYESYQWLLNGEPVFGSNGQSFKPDISGNYSVVVETDLGCIDTSEVIKYPIIDLNIPNVITPNGDGINDYLVIDNLPELSELVIFNRSNMIVFQSANYLNNWGGENQQGILLDNGTYWYKLMTSSGKKYSGYIVINR